MPFRIVSQLYRALDVTLIRKRESALKIMIPLNFQRRIIRGISYVPSKIVGYESEGGGGGGGGKACTEVY